LKINSIGAGKKHSKYQSILPSGNKDMKVKKCQLTFPS